MKTDEIIRISRKAILDLLRGRNHPVDDYDGLERRRRPRWPFPGTIELRPVEGCGTRQWFGTVVNLSEGGLAITTEQPFAPETELEIAFHLPEASFYGRANVRYCMDTPRGHMIGLQFTFDDE